MINGSVLPRVIADVAVIACVLVAGALAKAYAAEPPQAFAVAFVNQLPAILTAMGVLVTAVLGFLTLKRSNTAIAKTEVVHELVNSKFSAAQAEIVALKREIASRRDSTVDDRVSADVARDQLQKDKPPAVNPPGGTS